MEAAEAQKIVEGIPDKSPVLFAYVRGSKRHARGEREAAANQNLGQYIYFGVLVSKGIDSAGRFYFNVLCENRMNEETGEPRALRTFVPSHGELLAFTKINIP